MYRGSRLKRDVVYNGSLIKKRQKISLCTQTCGCEISPRVHCVHLVEMTREESPLKRAKYGVHPFKMGASAGFLQIKALPFACCSL